MQQWTCSGGNAATLRIAGAMTRSLARMRRVAAAALVVLAALGVTAADRNRRLRGGSADPGERRRRELHADSHRRALRRTRTADSARVDRVEPVGAEHGDGRRLAAAHASTILPPPRMSSQGTSRSRPNLAMRRGRGPSTSSPSATTSSPHLPIPAGATVRIDLTVAMADVDGLTAQDESANLAFAVDVRDAQEPFPAEPCSAAWRRRRRRWRRRRRR